MKPKLLIIYLLLVLVPLALLAGLGVRMAHDEQTMMRQRFREILTDQLREIDATIAGLVAARERDLQQTLELPDFDPSRLRELIRDNPFIRQLFVLDKTGQRLYPPAAGPYTTAERDFLERAGQIWKDQQQFYRNSEGAADHGWYVWFWGNGFNLAYWRRDAAGNIRGAEVERTRLMADIIAALPEAESIGGRITLADSAGNPVYQWGAHTPSPTELPQATLPLATPLNTWHLAYYAPVTGFGQSLRSSLFIGLAGIALALTLLAIYFYRENTRQLREATQRVSFVNQVSHELKTPLTNIRLYAELLEKDLPETNRHVGIIVAESQRLSRLIANVLRFARPRTLHKTAGTVDETVRSVIEDFTPALAAKDIVVNFTGNAPRPVEFDADALEQILGNLLSNVEKYAPGKPVTVTTVQTDRETLITVTDGGPGIPAGQRDDIFKPFYRLSNKLSDGVTGTGIGLTIARDLARQHGGDLVLLPADVGASFQVKLTA
ncbi:MAG: Sensor histidine kinase RcsC [Verrucomicrobiae bacterium]|nr:Sensor histidine kinase RcsC [Verrucomicrobiae bacterium]